MPAKSAGLLLYRKAADGGFEFLLVHPGGPFWRNKDDGAWSIPKGEFADDEDPLKAAQREFKEELGVSAPQGKYIQLKPIKQKAGKVVHAWAVEGDFDPPRLRSNSFSLEWPPKSGKIQQFPEVDRAAWFSPEVARRKILAGQLPLIDQTLTFILIVAGR